MYVLVACEESQIVCAAFRAKGHIAFSCDLQDCSGLHPEWHIKTNVLSLLNKNNFFYTCDQVLHLVYKWDLIIAHPPCTYLSKAGARWLYCNGSISKDRYLKGLAAKDFFMKLYNCGCEKICIENPTPLKIFDLPLPSCVIQPYLFDIFGLHPYSKRTLLWLKGLPPLIPTTPNNVCVGTFVPSNTSKFSKGFGGGKGVAGRDSISRSKTFLGVAAAMAEQWG